MMSQRSEQVERPTEDPYGIQAELEKAPRPIGGRKSNIADFYANRSILITGASGFIGKVLIEKLIRTCPNTRRIFVLIRPKWNKKPVERLRELLQAPLFDGLRGERLDERVILVEGDVTEPNLGLGGNDLLRIIKEVSVIFHSAATVKFDEPLKQSVAINIAGTKNMIDLCRRIPQLAALVHVSTAYANCDRDEVEEHIYPLDMDPEKLIQMADWLDQDTLQELKRRLLGARPNTYTYTKALAEWLLVRSARDLPVVICRPSIVVATRQEPFKGWIDNVNGPTGVILGAGKGLVRSMFAEKSFVADLVPVDMVINLVLALGWFGYINKDQKHLNEPLDSFTESILSGRSASPSASACSNSSAASSSGDEMGYELEQQHDSLLSNSSAALGGIRADKTPSAASAQQQQLQQQQQDLATDSAQHQQFQGKQLASAPAQQLDDGYASLKSSDYNSVGSSASDTASTASSASLTHRNHHHHHLHLHHHHRHHHNHNNNNNNHLSVYGSNGGPRRRQHRAAVKMSCTAIEEQQQQSAHLQTSETGADEELQNKLRLLRQKTKAKLNEAELPEELADIPVFHCTSGKENPITWGKIQFMVIYALALFPSLTTYRYPCGSFTNNKLKDKFYRLTLHYIPAYIVDFFVKLFGGKPMIVKIFNKFDQAAGVLEAFTSKQWNFNYDNRMFLYNELMTQEDRRLFNFDISSMDWNEFLRDYVLGVRKFMLKEPMNNLEQARHNLKITYYRNLSLQILFFATIAYYFVFSCL